MQSSTQARLQDGAFWRRALLMLVFVIAYNIAELVLALTVLVQFFSILFTGRAVEPLLKFGNGLSSWTRQVFRFLTYNSETVPFPFADWPDEPLEGERWRGEPGEAPAAETGGGTAPGPHLPSDGGAAH